MCIRDRLLAEYAQAHRVARVVRAPEGQQVAPRRVDAPGRQCGHVSTRKLLEDVAAALGTGLGFQVLEQAPVVVLVLELKLAVNGLHFAPSAGRREEGGGKELRKSVQRTGEEF